MSTAAPIAAPETQNALFLSDHPDEQIPPELARATARLRFPPSYVIVGVYRLFTDKALYIPAWQKCKHAIQRGSVVAIIWAASTYKIQKTIIKLFLMNTTRVTGLSHETVFGHKVPFDLPTWAAFIFIGGQVTMILKMFLSHNIRIARERAWAQTVASRGKGPDFWQPYVEEWVNPPVVDESVGGRFQKLAGGFAQKVFIKNILLLPFSLYPIVGTFVKAYFKASGTSRYLHKPYFEAKNMTPHQQAVFIEERKYDYLTFGFTAALLEGLPIIGLIFTISNRVGAAMWAHDLEKRQHFVRAQRLGVPYHDEKSIAADKELEVSPSLKVD